MAEAATSGEKIQKAGDFHAEKIEFITSTGLSIDLLGNVLHITFFEDIQSGAITGNCIINDVVNLAVIGPVIGQEYIRLKLRSNGLKEQEGVIDFTEHMLLVNSLQLKEQGANGNQFLILEFSTSELQKDQRIRINQSYSGTFSEIFKKIMRSQLNSKKKLYVEPTRGNKKIVFPNFSPFEAINYMKRNSVSAHDGSPTYMFFEDFKGYHFRSLSTMYSEPTSFTYTTSVPGSNINDPFTDMRTVIDYNIQGIGDSLAAQRLGSYGSELITYDTYTRRFKTTTYNYLDNFKNETHVTAGRDKNIDEFPLISSTPVQDRSRLSDFSARRYLVPHANFVDDDGNYTDLTVVFDEQGKPVYHSPQTETWLQKRQSQLLQLERGITCTIQTNGNTLLDCGDIVEFNLPSNTSAKTEKQERYDFFYRGRFLIKSIRQDFDFSKRKHESLMSLVKDSLPSEISPLTESLETEPENNGEIIEDFYDA